jgi:hypothetical protein
MNVCAQQSSQPLSQIRCDHVLYIVIKLSSCYFFFDFATVSMSAVSWYQ